MKKSYIFILSLLCICAIGLAGCQKANISAPAQNVTQTRITETTEDNGNQDTDRRGDEDCKDCPQRKKTHKKDDKCKMPVDIFENEDGEDTPEIMPDETKIYEIKFNVFVLPKRPVYRKPAPPKDVNEEKDENNDNDGNAENGI